MTRKSRISELRDAFLSGQRFLIVSHKNPDGDAIGSSLALASGLDRLRKSCDVVNADGVPMSLTWLPFAERIHPQRDEAKEYDAVVLLDCGAPNRTGFSESILGAGRQVVNIDHHPGNSEYGTLNLVDPEAAATAVLVHDLLRAIPVPVDYSAATAIYTAILTDTGSFRFSNANARAFEIAAAMVSKGVDASWVAQMVYDQQSVGRLRLLSCSLDTLELSPRDKAACMTVTRSMLRSTHTGIEDVEGFANYARSICGVEVGLLLREEEPGRFRVALRSKGRVDVAAIAGRFGGGGHRNAAGATIEGDPGEIKRQIFGKIEEALDEELLQRRQAG